MKGDPTERVGAAVQRLADVTPWFSGSVRPARPGVYHFAFMPKSSTCMFKMWTGYVWLIPRNTARAAASMKVPSIFQHDRDATYFRWRGLVQPPETQRPSHGSEPDSPTTVVPTTAGEQEP